MLNPPNEDFIPKMSPSQSRVGRILSMICETLAWAGVGATVGAALATLFGILCGLLWGLLQSDASRVLSVAFSCTIAGAAAGALAGVAGRLVDGEIPFGSAANSDASCERRLPDLTSSEDWVRESRQIVVVSVGSLTRKPRDNPLSKTAPSLN